MIEPITYKNHHSLIIIKYPKVQQDHDLAAADCSYAFALATASCAAWSKPLATCMLRSLASIISLAFSTFLPVMKIINFCITLYH